VSRENSAGSPYYIKGPFRSIVTNREGLLPKALPILLLLPYRREERMGYILLQQEIVWLLIGMFLSYLPIRLPTNNNGMH
jgi:hypothetical protein